MSEQLRIRRALCANPVRLAVATPYRTARRYAEGKPTKAEHLGREKGKRQPGCTAAHWVSSSINSSAVIDRENIG